MRAVSIAVCWLLCACPASLRRPADRQANLAGTIYFGGDVRRGDPLEGATITVTRAADGIELGSNVSSSTGGWRITFAADPDTRVVVGFSAPGLVPNFRALDVGPFTDAQVSVALEPPDPMECTDSQCVSASDDLSLSGVPDTVIGSARVFEASTETPRLVGLELFRPLVVAWYQLDAGPDAGLQTNDAGEVDAEFFDAGPPVDAGVVPLGPPQLRIRVPFVAWRKVEDAAPGTGVIEVPFLSLDERKGSWSKQADGWLESEYGLKLPESALAAVHAGQFFGGVVAVAVVKTPGYWAIALPAAAPGCLTGKIEADGQNGEGALVSLEGAEPATAHSDGTFCLAAPVTLGGAVDVQYAGLTYSGGTQSGPEVAGACGGTCRNAGTVKVSTEQLAPAKVCRFSGTAVDGAGAPLAGAVVIGFDESVGGTSFNSLCGKLGTRCTLSTSADAQGSFTLNLPLLSGLTLTATALVEAPGVVEASRRGTLLLRECPTAVVQLRLLQGRDKLDPTLTLTGNAIAWSPAKPAAVLRGIDAQGALKWELQSVGGFAPPLTWGQVPAGATQLTPTTGTPAALTTGDEVSVVLAGTGGDGYQFSGSTAATVP